MLNTLMICDQVESQVKIIILATSQYILSVLGILSIQIPLRVLKQFAIKLEIPVVIILNSLTFLAFCLAVYKLINLSRVQLVVQEREKNKYKKIMDTIQEGILVIKDGVLCMANTMAKRLLYHNFGKRVIKEKQRNLLKMKVLYIFKQYESQSGESKESQMDDPANRRCKKLP